MKGMKGKESAAADSNEPATDAPAVRRFRDARGARYAPLCANLAEVRAHIDRLDGEIVRLLAERGRYVQDAARFKRNLHQVAAPVRQQQVFERVHALAAAHGADPDVVDAAYRALVAAFVAKEQRYFDEMESVEKDSA